MVSAENCFFSAVSSPARTPRREGRSKVPVRLGLGTRFRFRSNFDASPRSDCAPVHYFRTHRPLGHWPRRRKIPYLSSLPPRPPRVRTVHEFKRLVSDTARSPRSGSPAAKRLTRLVLMAYFCQIPRVSKKKKITTRISVANVFRSAYVSI